MQRTVTDRYLPPDRAAYVAAEPPTGRLIVIAPTRAACETIELALGLRIPTILEKQHGSEIRALAAAGLGDPEGCGGREGIGNRRGTGDRQDAFHPADRRDDTGNRCTESGRRDL